MKIALVIPKNSSDNGKSFYDYSFYSKFMLSKKYVSYLLAIPTLVSLTPKHHEIRVFDENIEGIDYSWKADLAGISLRTMFANRAYAIAKEYRKRKVKTVLGGIHPSMCTEEALRQSDCVVVGEAEGVWQKLLRDAEKGQLKRIYGSNHFVDLEVTPIPDRSTISSERYLSHIVQTSKGCPLQCEFCSVTAFDGKKIRHRSMEHIIHEIANLNTLLSKYKKKTAIFFADDNIIADKEFARQLFLALKPHDINWMCQSSVNISREDELLKVMRESGCGAIFIGFESLSQKNLASMRKGINQRYDYLQAIARIQSHGMLVHSSFIVGCDFDTQDTFEDLINFIEEARLLMPLINILTPFPGTELFERFEREGRILHKDWSKYDSKHVVFSPAGMSPDELYEGYRRVVKTVYSFEAILEKLKFYWQIDYWKRSNQLDPVQFKYRLLFAVRLCSMLVSRNKARSKFILKLMPHVFRKRVRISTVLALMAYNDFASTL